MNAGDEREGFAGFLLRLRTRGIAAKEFLAAFEATPRNQFVAGEHHRIAWSDRTIPIECGETIEPADLQATILASLGLEPGHRVLEIGTGTGFTAAVMARLSGRVTSMERYRTLAELARRRLESLGIPNAFVRHADGAVGLQGEGPFDRIVAWVAFESMPRTFVDQLSSGGVMIVPIGLAEDRQTLVRLTKVGSRFEREDIGEVRLQPLLKGLAAKL